jgi:hypothetical protein
MQHFNRADGDGLPDAIIADDRWVGARGLAILWKPAIVGPLDH